MSAWLVWLMSDMLDVLLMLPTVSGFVLVYTTKGGVAVSWHGLGVGVRQRRHTAADSLSGPKPNMCRAYTLRCGVASALATACGRTHGCWVSPGAACVDLTIANDVMCQR
jgi:hypothetical protein